MKEAKTPAAPCPPWAERLLKDLRQLEIQLGNIREVDSPWSYDDLDEISRRAFAAEDDEAGTAANERMTEVLFAKIAHGLHAEGHDAEGIATIINQRMASQARLPYCNAGEVKAALESLV